MYSNISKDITILGLEVYNNISDSVIKKAYKKLALKYHPDKNQTAGAQAQFVAIQAAHERLLAIPVDQRRVPAAATNRGGVYNNTYTQTRASGFRGTTPNHSSSNPYSYGSGAYWAFEEMYYGRQRSQPRQPADPSKAPGYGRPKPKADPSKAPGYGRPQPQAQSSASSGSGSSTAGSMPSCRSRYADTFAEQERKEKEQKAKVSAEEERRRKAEEERLTAEHEARLREICERQERLRKEDEARARQKAEEKAAYRERLRKKAEAEAAAHQEQLRRKFEEAARQERLRKEAEKEELERLRKEREEREEQERLRQEYRQYINNEFQGLFNHLNECVSMAEDFHPYSGVSYATKIKIWADIRSRVESLWSVRSWLDSQQQELLAYGLQCIADYDHAQRLEAERLLHEKREAEERTRQEALEQARLQEAERIRQEAEHKACQEVERQEQVRLRLETENKAQLDAEFQARIAAEKAIQIERVLSANRRMGIKLAEIEKKKRVTQIELERQKRAAQDQLDKQKRSSQALAMREIARRKARVADEQSSPALAREHKPQSQPSGAAKRVREQSISPAVRSSIPGSIPGSVPGTKNGGGHEAKKQMQLTPGKAEKLERLNTQFNAWWFWNGNPMPNNPHHIPIAADLDIDGQAGFKVGGYARIDGQGDTMMSGL